MPTYTLSDIHGNNKLFQKALRTIGLTKSDRLLILGDQASNLFIDPHSLFIFFQ